MECGGQCKDSYPQQPKKLEPDIKFMVRFQEASEEDCCTGTVAEGWGGGGWDKDIVGRGNGMQGRK